MAFSSFLGVAILSVITKIFAFFLNTPDSLRDPNGNNKHTPVSRRRSFLTQIKMVALLFVSLLLHSVYLLAQNTFDGISIQANSGERDLKNHSIELNGNVQIIFKGQHLRAQKATIHQETKTFEAEGQVLFVTPTATIGGNKIVMNYETNIGTIFSGFIQSGQILFEGDVIEKKGDDEYLTFQSQFTSCTTCPPAWSFSGQSIDAKIGGYAVIKNTFIHFGTVPVLWLPYLIVPLKSDRQTGLLAPSMEFYGSVKFENLLKGRNPFDSKGEFSFSQPFFWAISRSQDATLTLQTYSLRGLKGLANYRYILDQNSSGELDTGLIQDKIFGHSDRYKQFLSESSRVNRWFMRYKHYWVLPNDWIQRTDINNASDLNYSNDFPFETLNKADPAAESRFSLTKNTDNHHFSIDSSYYINSLRSNPLGNNQDSVHRLPEVSFSSTRQPWGETGIFYNYDLRYTNFARNDFSYDDMTILTGPNGGRIVRQVSNSCYSTNDSYDPYPSSERKTPAWDILPTCKPVHNGVFDYGTDLIRSGQRFIIEPSLTRPTELGDFFNLVPKISYRESHYNFGIENVPNLSRRFLRTEIKLQTSFSKIFGDLNDSFSDRYKHEIQPEIITTSVPWLEQPSHPFLGYKNTSEIPFSSRDAISDSDLEGIDANGIQFDYDDRLYDRNLITYRLTNKVTQKSWSPNQLPSYNRLLTWRLSQTYDVYESQQSGSRKPWSDIESILNIRTAHFNTYSKVNFFPYQKLSDISSHMTVNDDDGNYIKIGLSQKYTTNSEGNIDTNGRTEDYLLQVGTTAKLINFAGRLIYNGNDISAARDGTRIKQLTYALILRPPGNCWGITFLQHQELATEKPIYKVNFDFLFDGKTSLQSPTKLLEAYGF